MTDDEVPTETHEFFLKVLKEIRKIPKKDRPEVIDHTLMVVTAISLLIVTTKNMLSFQGSNYYETVLVAPFAFIITILGIFALWVLCITLVKYVMR